MSKPGPEPLNRESLFANFIGRAKWLARLKDSKAFEVTTKLVTNAGILAFVAPLLQSEFGIRVWTIFLLGVAVAAILYILASKKKITLNPIWLRRASRLLVPCLLLLLVILAIRPFYGLSGRAYVAITEEGLSPFDPKRYVSESETLSEGTALIVANHPAHRWMAGFLHESEPDLARDSQKPVRHHWLAPIRWFGSLARSMIFSGKVVILHPITRTQDKVVPIFLKRAQSESWTDLAGSPCNTFQFDLRSDRAISFELAATPIGEADDGLTRIGTDFAIELASIEGKKMRFSMVSRTEDRQWQDVALFNDFNEKTALYIARLSELLISPNLRNTWAETQAGLWDTVPNDRERLRLLQLRASLDSVVAEGNILNAQLLPDLIRIESILFTAIDGPESLTRDQLLYWSTKQFLKFSDRNKRRFETTNGILSRMVAEAEPAMEPVGLPESPIDFVHTIGRLIPPNLWAREEVQNLIASMFSKTSGVHEKVGDSVSPKLAWARAADWESIRTGLTDLAFRNNSPNPDHIEESAAFAAQSPSLEEIWAEAETKAGQEFLRRVLLHCSHSLELLLDEPTQGNAITAVADLLEAILQQGDLLDAVLELRQRHFGDSKRYLANSSVIQYLQAATILYAKSNRQVVASPDAAKEISPPPASGSEVAPLVEFLKPFANFTDHPSVAEFLDDEDFRKKLVDSLRNPEDWVRLDPRLKDLMIAYLTPLEPGKAIKETTPWLEWTQSLISDPACLELKDKLNNEEFPDLKLIEKFGPIVKTMPNSVIGQDTFSELVSKAVSIFKAAREINEANDSDQVRELARIASDGSLVVRETLHQSKIFSPFGEFLDRVIVQGNVAAFAHHLEMPSSEVEFLKLWQENLRLKLSTTTPVSVLSPSEQRLWTLIGRVVWFSGIPEDRQPVAIVYDEKNGSIGFDPPCPELTKWIREATTGDTNLGDGNAYPYLSEALLFDLILRTMDDHTPNGYVHTEFGKLRGLFQSLARQSIEEYVTDTFPAKPETGAGAEASPLLKTGAE